MVPDSPPAPATAAPERPAPAVRDKVRLRFRKGLDLRLLSHHDLLRAFERMLRRAALPFRTSQGFNPRPRIVFALSLPLGVLGREEVVELELSEVLPVEELRGRLARVAPPGLEIGAVRRIPASVTARIHALCYRTPVPRDRVAALAPRIEAFTAAPEYWMERTRPPRRRVNLRDFVRGLRLAEVSAGETLLPLPGGRPAPALEMDLRLTPHGTARPEEVLAAVGLTDLLEAGAFLERCRLELTDEVSPPPTQVPHEERNAD